MYRIIFIFSVLVLYGPRSWAQGTPLAYQEFDLDNGLHVILHSDPSVPVVVVSVLYHVGSKNEDPQRTGFAHFFEHLLFEGSEHMQRGDFDKWVALGGGYNNAYTTQDRTYYYELFPSNQLELGLWLESERMLHAKILQEGVDTQREVVKEEKRQRQDNAPYGSFLQRAFEGAYSVHPYKWIPIGSMEHLDAARLDEFMAFYRRYYRPNNAVLSIAGNFDYKEAKTLVKKYFADIPRGTQRIERPTVQEPPLGGEKRSVVYDNIQLPAVIHVYRGPALYSDDYYAFDMLSSVLTNGRSSRMYKSLVDQKQLALQTASFPFPLVEPGLAISFGLVNQGVPYQDLEAAMELEYERVKDELISQFELDKLMNQYEKSLSSDRSTMAAIAEDLAIGYMHFGRTNLRNEHLGRYRKVSREAIREVARKYLNKDNRVCLVFLPKSFENKQ